MLPNASPPLFLDKGLARVPRPDNVRALIRARIYRPVYPE
jgi:hypothetical protein